MAARELSARGLSTWIIEARDRTGGRCRALPGDHHGVLLELGAEFIHGDGACGVQLLRETGTAAIDAPRSRFTLQRGRLVQSRDLFPTIQGAFARHRKRLRLRDLALDAFLDTMDRRTLPNDARRFARMMVEGFDAADPARVSARDIVQEWSEGGAGGGAQARPLRGYEPMIEHLTRAARANGARLQLETIVESVLWTSGQVRVHARAPGGLVEVRARTAIVTLPLAVLQAEPDARGAVRFDPPLRAKTRALSRLAMGPAVKVLLRYRSRFWESLDEGRFRNAAFFHAPDAPLPTFWTALPVRSPLLVGWAGGAAASALAGSDAAAMLEAALASLRQLFGPHEALERDLEGLHWHDWERDPYTRGAYSYVLAGAGRARNQLAAPLANTLFFAGEATDDEAAATVEGAFASGQRAAREVAARLQPSA